MIRRHYHLPLSMFADMSDLQIAFSLLDYDRSIWPLEGVDEAISLIEAAEEAVECQDAWGSLAAACSGIGAMPAIAAVL